MHNVKGYLSGIGICAVVLLLVGGRILFQSSLQWGMGPDWEQDLPFLVIGELFFLAIVLLGTLGGLKRSGWSMWLGIVPVFLVAFSSPLLLQFERFWIEYGWSVAQVVNLIPVANLMMIAFVTAVVFASLRKS